MTLGTGLFLSSVFLGLIFLFHSTKDRWNWKKIMKRSGISILALLVLGSSIAAYFNFQSDIEAFFSNSEAVANLNTPKVHDEFWGVKIGASQDDVLFLKGKPNKKGKVTTNSRETRWQYKEKYQDEEHIVYFDVNKKVDAVRMFGGGYRDCLNRICFHSTIERLNRLLGKPTKLKKSANKLFWIYNYAKYQTQYILEKGEVDAIGILKAK